MNTYSPEEIDALFAALPHGFTRYENRVVHPNLYDTVSVVMRHVDGGRYSLDIHVQYYLVPFNIMWMHYVACSDWKKAIDKCASCQSQDLDCKHYFHECILVGVSEDIFKDVFAWLNRYTRDSNQFIVWQGDDMKILPHYWKLIMHPALEHIEAIHSALHDHLCRVLNFFQVEDIVHGLKFRFDGVPNGVKIVLVATYADIGITITINDLLLSTYEVTVIIRGAVLSILPDDVHCGDCKRGGNTEMCAHMVKTIRCEYHSENPGRTKEIGAAVGILVRDIQALAHPVPVPMERILKPFPIGGCLKQGDCEECGKRYLDGLSESKTRLE